MCVGRWEGTRLTVSCVCLCIGMCVGGSVCELRVQAILSLKLHPPGPAWDGLGEGFAGGSRNTSTQQHKQHSWAPDCSAYKEKKSLCSPIVRATVYSVSKTKTPKVVHFL